MKFEIQVDPQFGDTIDIRWWDSLGSRRNLRYREIEESLEDIDGVESVIVNRYSARVVIAEHVTSGAVAVPLIQEQLSRIFPEGKLTLVRKQVW